MARKTYRPGRTLVVFFLGVLLAYGLVALTGTWKPELGLDLQGGTRIQLQALGNPSKDSLEEARSIIDQRVNGQGVAEAEVTTQGSEFVVVEIPGENRRDLVELVQRQAQLRFRLVACSDGDPTPCSAQAAPDPGSAPTAPVETPGTGVTAPPSSPPASPSTSASPTASESSPGGANRPPVGFADGTDAPTQSPTDKASQTPSGDSSPTDEPTGQPTDQPTDETTDAPAEGGPSSVEAELKWMNAPTGPQVQQFNQFTCDPDGTLLKADGTPAALVDDSDKPLVACSMPEQSSDGEPIEPSIKYLLSRAVVEGTELDSASAGIPQNDVSWVVNLQIGGDGKDDFTKISRALYGTEDQFAIVLDGKVLSAPTMNGIITNGDAQISGNFTESSATSLATSLKYGALPISFSDDATIDQIGPSLAGNQLSAGLTAGLFGIILVMLYCLFYYRGLGLVVIASLLVAAAVTYAMVLLLSEAANFTLTLPGIAGLIVAVGITADSFIVFFERIRDEMRDGKSMRVAVEVRLASRPEHLPCRRHRLAAGGGGAVHLRRRRGQGLCVRARPLDPDRPGGLLLVHQTDGVVACPLQVLQPRAPTVRPRRRRTGRRVDQPRRAGHRRHRGREGLMGKFARLGNELYTGKKSIDFVGRRWIWYSVSALIVLVAILGLTVKHLNMGIEFTGGAQFTVTVPTDEANQDTADKLRETVASSGIDNASSPIVNTQGETAIVVQTEPLTEEESNEIGALLRETAGVGQDAISEREIGASWGEEVAKRSATGLVVFLILVVLFIWAYFRQWKMSVAALVALVHDVLITIGVYALSGFEVTPATVTGLLTILGFSLYDTVVVFDKVRENTNNLRQTRMTYAGAANLAVNQTLVRSINTSIVALIPVGVILYVSAVQLGSSSLKDLSLALFVGTAAGVYSSIFIATPLLAHLKSGESEVVLAERRAKARAKQADRYASVPVFTDDTVVEPGSEPDDEIEDEGPVEQPTGPRAPDAMGRGRTTPTPRRPVGESRSSGRQQPSRQPKSQRKKP